MEEKNAEAGPILTSREARAIARVGRETLTTAVRTGALKAIRLPGGPAGRLRFFEGDLLRWLSSLVV